VSARAGLDAVVKKIPSRFHKQMNNGENMNEALVSLMDTAVVKSYSAKIYQLADISLRERHYF
jgi:hypothetical protein